MNVENKPSSTERMENLSSSIEALIKAVTPVAEAARHAIEVHREKLQQIATAINEGIAAFIENHKEVFVGLAQFAEVYPKLRPYLENIIKGFEDPDFEIANDVVEMAHIFAAIDLNSEPESCNLMTLIKSDNFTQSIHNIYKASSLNEARISLIKEALDLHEVGSYGGSVCLLYGLIEGVLTESFEKAKYIINTYNRVHAVKADGSVDKRVLTGLVPKLNHAITREDHLIDYYRKILTYELVSGNEEETIPKTRNSVLHGSSLDFNTEKRSAQLILWLYSTLLHVEALGVNDPPPTQ